MATTFTSVGTLVLIALSVASSTRDAVRRAGSVLLRPAHAAMAVAMVLMAVSHLAVVQAIALVLLAWAGRRVAAHLHRSVFALPCLIDVVGMLVLTGLTLIGALSGDPKPQMAAHAPMLTFLTPTAGMLWAMEAVRLRKSSLKLAAVTALEPKMNGERTVRAAGGSSLRSIRYRWTGLSTTLLTTAAMTAMALTHP